MKQSTLTMFFCLCFLTVELLADDGAGVIELLPDRPLLVRKIPVTDSRVVRGFTHAPVDGREDTRYSTGVVSEWNGIGGTPAVNYRRFNGNNGLHVTLAEAGVDAIQIRGNWRGKVYVNHRGLSPPDGAPLCKIEPKDRPFCRQFENTVQARRLSFFYNEGQTGSFKDLTILRIGGEKPKGEAIDLVVKKDVAISGGRSRENSIDSPATNSHESGYELQASWTDPSLGITAVTLELDVSAARRDTILTVRVTDVLDARRSAMTVDFQLQEPGRYEVCLDVPDQVFLAPESAWKSQPRMKGPFAPEPKLRVSITSNTACHFAALKLKAHRVPHDKASPEAVAWRKFLLRGLFSAMSEPRPWMHLVDEKPIREQIQTSPAIKRYQTSLLEVLETAEIALLLAPDDELIRQYHDWLYQNIDRRKPQPPPVLRGKSRETSDSANRPSPRESGDDAPRWAVLVRENWIEQAHIARWWLDTRLTPNGELGGGPQDDTDMFQVWQCLPMIESEPLGTRLKDAAAKLADIMLEHHLEEGINRRSMDALHAYEEGVNQLALNAWWNYGDPVHFERAMASARSAMKLMVETDDGRVHFGSDHLGIEEARNGFKNIGASPGAFGWAPARLFLHVMYVVADYNRNPALLDRYTKWGQTWLDYQKPNAFVEKVDIKSGKPIKVINLPTSANVSPVEDLLALHQLTGDAKWHASYKMGVDGNGFTGAVAQYGRCTHALVPWDEIYRSRLRKQFSDPSSGYAGFFVNKDRDLLDKSLADSLSWFRRYRHMNTVAEQKTDRVLTYKATVPMSCYLGDAPNRNRWLNLTAVSYEQVRGEDFAALVWDAGPKSLRVALYNFRDKPLTGRMRVWRLEHGRYRVRSGPDHDDDGTFDEAAADQQLELQCYSAIPLKLPPEQVTVLTIEQLERLGDIRSRADLALSHLDAKTVKVHNIGAGAAGNVRVVLRRGEKEIESRLIEKLTAPLDLYPRAVKVELNAMQPGDVVVVDPNNAIAEIAEHNNRIRVNR